LSSSIFAKAFDCGLWLYKTSKSCIFIQTTSEQPPTVNRRHSQAEPSVFAFPLQNYKKNFIFALFYAKKILTSVLFAVFRLKLLRVHAVLFSVAMREFSRCKIN